MSRVSLFHHWQWILSSRGPAKRWLVSSRALCVAAFWASLLTVPPVPASHLIPQTCLLHLLFSEQLSLMLTTHPFQMALPSSLMSFQCTRSPWDLGAWHRLPMTTFIWAPRLLSLNPSLYSNQEAQMEYDFPYSPVGCQALQRYSITSQFLHWALLIASQISAITRLWRKTLALEFKRSGKKEEVNL